MNKILLGFSVPKGDRVLLPLHHLAIFGMTQLSGKTTTLEALISRSGLRAIAFKTKRGETGFHSYNQIQSYYKPRADWQFVEGLVNVALQEKVKYEAGMRSAIMKACQATRDLKEVQKNATALSKSERSAFMRSVFERLVAYLDIVIPELEKWAFSQTIDVSDGINVMDITGMRLETQQLVIASTISHVFEKLSDVVIVIPEAWEMIPELKMTPVKWVAEQFIRKGASVGNYLWIDSQDIGGVSKVPLRQCDNWLMGRMREAHEVERILKQLLGVRIPREEIQTLQLGQFYAVVGDRVTKVYVLPVGVPEEEGRDVALGKKSPEFIRDKYLKKSEGSMEEANSETVNKLVVEINTQYREIQKLREGQEELKRQIDKIKREPSMAPTVQSTGREPQVVDLEHRELVLNISHSEKVVELDTEKGLGRILFCSIKDLPKEGFTEGEISDALNERGWHMGHSTLAPNLAGLAKKGLLVRVAGTKPQKYRTPSLLKINVRLTEDG